MYIESSDWIKYFCSLIFIRSSGYFMANYFTAGQENTADKSVNIFTYIPQIVVFVHDQFESPTIIKQLLLSIFEAHLLHD